MLGNNYQIDKKLLVALPLNTASTNDQKSFVEIVDKILSRTQSVDYLQNPAKQAKVHDLEKQIDKLVYDLYNLTPEEIKIVENSQ